MPILCAAKVLFREFLSRRAMIQLFLASSTVRVSPSSIALEGPSAVDFPPARTEAGKSRRVTFSPLLRPSHARLRFAILAHCRANGNSSTLGALSAVKSFTVSHFPSQILAGNSEPITECPPFDPAMPASESPRPSTDNRDPPGTCPPSPFPPGSCWWL